MIRGRRVCGLFAAICLAVALSSCDYNMLVGPGAFRVIDGGIQFVVCEDGVIAELRATAYGAEIVEVWDARGRRDTSAGEVLDQRTVEADFPYFNLTPLPILSDGDDVSIAVVLDSDESSVVNYPVTEAALNGEWVDSYGEPTDPSCS